MGGCGSLFTNLCCQETIAGKYSVRHFSGTQQALENGQLARAFWSPGTGNPAGGPAKVKSDMVTSLRMPQSGPFCPGVPRPLEGAPS